MKQLVPTLDKGFVQLLRVSANVDFIEGNEENGGQLILTPTDDSFIANDARASLGKTVDTVGAKEEKLIAFLEREKHTAPFRGAVMSFRVKAPLMVARQWFKYAVGSDHDESAALRDPFFSWSEESRRYVEGKPEFYVPAQWRSSPEKRMQGSGPPLDNTESAALRILLNDYQQKTGKLYEEMIAAGICAEQARLFLAAYGLYTTWIWTASVQGIIHFLRQRRAASAQEEIQQFAAPVLDFVRYFHPLAAREFDENP